MNVLEALQALKDGKKIRKKDWLYAGYYIQLNEHNQIIDLHGDVKQIYTDSLNDEWELYDDAKHFDCFEAMKRLKDGKKVSFYSDSRLYYVEENGYIMFHAKCSSMPINFLQDDFLSKYWHEVE